LHGCLSEECVASLEWLAWFGFEGWTFVDALQLGQAAVTASADDPILPACFVVWSWVWVGGSSWRLSHEFENSKPRRQAVVLCTGLNMTQQQTTTTNVNTTPSIRMGEFTSRIEEYSFYKL